MKGLAPSPRVGERVTSAIGEFSVVERMEGGSVSGAYRIRTATRDLLLKTRRGDPAIYHREAEGIEALRTAGSGLRLPEVVGLSDPRSEEHGWIVLEWIDRGAPTGIAAQSLGRGLARLHRATQGPEAGWPRPTFIGPYLQENGSTGDWARFWRENRLRPQLERAVEGGHAVGETGEWDGLFAQLDTLLEPPALEGFSLLHGDLWSGNVLEDRVGRPVLIDPAVYRGHREVDLAMMELFGGFPADVFTSYRESWPLLDGYPRRRSIYQLYYLLVHLNLFGQGYLSRTRAALQRALRG